MTWEVMGATKPSGTFVLVNDGFHQMLRSHRLRQRWSQEALALEAGVSPRHLSCLERNKARPSREMVQRLARVLGLELREQNALLVGAGFASAYPSTPLTGSAMAPVQRAMEFVLAHQEPYPAVVIDRCWNVVRVNDGARRLFATFMDAASTPPPVAQNLVRATLHPRGLRPYLVNWSEVTALLVERVERASHAHPADEERRALLHEIREYPGVAAVAPVAPPGGAPVGTVHLRHGDDELRLFALLTSFGTPLDVTAENLTLESFFPADEATDLWFRARRPASAAAERR